MGADSAKYFQAAPLARFNHTLSFALARLTLTLSPAATTNTTVGELHLVWDLDCRQLTGPNLQGSPMTIWEHLGAGELCCFQSIIVAAGKL